MSVEKNHAFIVGGTSGIGLATARHLLDRGLRVTIAGRDPDKLAAARRDLAGDINAITLDATRPEDVRAAFERIGAFDHLVLALSSNKGLGPFRELDLVELRRAFEDKLWAHLQCAQAALPFLRKDGSITFVSAITARMASPGTAGVAAINSAIETVARVLAAELRPLRVNAVSPGLIDTPWWDFVPADQRSQVFAGYAAKTAAGRIGRPEEVAHAIGALIENGYVTGQVLACDGGLGLGV